MSIDSQKKQTEVVEEIVRELRQSYGLSASFFRAAASRIEMTDTDMQVIDLLESGGEATAGQLAELMGLTSGTFTAILKRLEKAGLVRRERDPDDGRRVLVKLATGSDGKRKIAPLFSVLGKTWEDLAAQYNDEQKAFLLEFLQHSNILAKEEISRLREAPIGDKGNFSAPLDNLESGRLILQAEGVQLILRAGDLAGKLYQARIEGPVPDIKVKDGVVKIRYPRRLWLPGTEKHTMEITLSTAIPWQITFQGGGAMMTAELDGLDLHEVEANGSGSTFSFQLPDPKRMVPIRLGGFGSEFNIRRPEGVAVRVQSNGWGSGVVFDNQPMSKASSAMPTQSPDYESADVGYDIETTGSGSMITITTG